MLNKKLNRDIIILAAIQTVLLTLKLCGVITWSWCYVTMPFSVGVVIALFFAIAIFI